MLSHRKEKQAKLHIAQYFASLSDFSKKKYCIILLLIVIIIMMNNHTIHTSTTIVVKLSALMQYPQQSPQHQFISLCKTGNMPYNHRPYFCLLVVYTHALLYRLDVDELLTLRYNFNFFCK